MNADILIAAQRLVHRLPVGDSVVEAILSWYAPRAGSRRRRRRHS